MEKVEFCSLDVSLILKVQNFSQHKTVELFNYLREKKKLICESQWIKLLLFILWWSLQK